MSALNWQKSSYSGQGANCINVAAADKGSVKLRESDVPDTVVTTTPQSLRALISRIKTGEVDRGTGSFLGTVRGSDHEFGGSPALSRPVLISHQSWHVAISLTGNGP